MEKSATGAGTDAVPGSGAEIGSTNDGSQLAGIDSDGLGTTSPKMGANHDCSQGKTMSVALNPLKKEQRLSDPHLLSWVQLPELLHRSVPHRCL